MKKICLLIFLFSVGCSGSLTDKITHFWWGPDFTPAQLSELAYKDGYAIGQICAVNIKKDVALALAATATEKAFFETMRVWGVDEGLFLRNALLKRLIDRALMRLSSDSPEGLDLYSTLVSGFVDAFNDYHAEL